MPSLNKSPIIAAICLAGGIAAADPGLRLESPVTRTRLLELFSSEGCSSCPPADARLVGLRQDPGLWKRFVPIAFHVDYWDGLGWPDRFASPEFTARQRRYAGGWGTGRVYTPAFVLDGREAGPSLPELPAAAEKVGALTVRSEGGRYHVTFTPAEAGTRWRIHGALLGNGLETPVGSGENARQVLRHEFVVLKMVSSPMRTERGLVVAELSIPAAAEPRAPRHSVAFWVTREGEQTPIQAVGGDLPPAP